jgi:hypothetical protein
MAVALPISILPLPRMTKQEKLIVMKERQRVLSEATLDALRAQDYELGHSLKIPGAFAFSARWRRQDIKIGIKTSADRWVAVPKDSSGGWGVLSRVDQVFVATWDQKGSPSRSPLPKRFQVYKFDPKTLVEIGKQVYAKADACNQTGMQWIPLDDYADRDSTSMAAGSLAKHGRIIFDESIQWTSEPLEVSDEAVEHQEIEELAAPLKLTIAEAKAGLAAHFRVSPDAIKIIIEG